VRSVISTKISPASIILHASENVRRKTCFRYALDVLPQRTQRIAGGAPKRSCSKMKSISFVITVTFASRAAKKILGSLARSRFKCRTLYDSVPNSLVSHGASAGDSCASIQTITRPTPGGLASGRRTAVRLEDLRLRDLASPRESAQLRDQPRKDRGHRSL